MGVGHDKPTSTHTPPPRLGKWEWGMISLQVHPPLPPGKKWSRLNLAEFAKEFNLSEMEKQANLLRKVGC